MLIIEIHMKHSHIFKMTFINVTSSQNELYSIITRVNLVE